MNSSPLKLKLIEAPLIIKSYVKGDERCNYEIYITEILNASEYFKQRFCLPFCAPASQSNGECDSYAGEYGLDYKLIASQTALQGRSIFSPQIEILMNGVYSIVGSKCHGGMNVTRIAQSLRGKSLDQLLQIRNSAEKSQSIDNDIREYMLTIETSKNLLLFFPYRFSFEAASELSDDCISIAKAVESDFGVSLRYRANLHPQLDTYLLYLYDYSFVLCQWNGTRLDFLEAIPVEKSDTFMHLALEYCEEWDEKYDVVLQKLRQQKKLS